MNDLLIAFFIVLGGIGGIYFFTGWLARKAESMPLINPPPAKLQKRINQAFGGLAVTPQDGAKVTRVTQAALEGPAEYTLKPGIEWNPLWGFPRNNPCFCGSKQKAKHCCLGPGTSLSRFMEQDDAEAVRAHWEKIITGEKTVIVTKESKVGNAGERQK
jgi:hypothetical protein